MRRIPIASVASAPGTRWAGGNSTLWLADIEGIAHVCKKYSNEILDVLDTDALARLTALEFDADWEYRDLIEEVTVWPRGVLVDDERVVGVVMEPLPAEYARTFADGSEPDTNTLVWLGVGAGYAARIGVPFYEPPQRLFLLSMIFEAMRSLHQAGVVVNDMQAGNIVFSEDLDSIKFLDCDSMHGEWGKPVPDIAPPDYAAARNHTGIDADLVKFAVMAIHVLQSRPGDDTVDADVLDPFLRPSHRTLLADAIRGDLAPIEQWRVMTAQWQQSVDDRGGLWTFTDGGGIRRWASTGPAQIVNDTRIAALSSDLVAAGEPLRQAVASGSAEPLPEKKRKGAWALAALAAIAAIVIILFVFVF